MASLSMPGLATMAVLAAFCLGCTCAPDQPVAQKRAEDSASSAAALTASGSSTSLIVTPAAAVGTWPVTLVLDPSGALCRAAVTQARERRHVVCDASSQGSEGEDLEARTLRRGLQQLKAEQGTSVGREPVELLVATPRAATARALLLREPAFFSRAAVWVGDSSEVASLFGPTFLGQTHEGSPRVLVLVGEGAKDTETWAALAARRGLSLARLPSFPLDSDAGWSRLAALLQAS